MIDLHLYITTFIYNHIIGLPVIGR